ncbi:MAG: hypothetical protein IT233_04130 [Bacteroidia bacterium]|nr:hypothetical protein [Bacteroidia bacterium]
MKHFFSLCFVSFLFLFSFSQDKIVLHSGEVLYGKVEEVGISEVKYRKQDNLTGPVYVISKTDIHAIHYENGTKDEFAGKQEKKDDDYVKKNENSKGDGDDVYSDGKGKKTNRRRHPHDHVDVIIPVWHAVGWLILADILFGCF